MQHPRPSVQRSSAQAGPGSALRVAQASRRQLGGYGTISKPPVTPATAGRGGRNAESGIAIRRWQLALARGRAAGQGGRVTRAFLLAAIAVGAAVIVAIVLSSIGAPASENGSSSLDRLKQCRPGDTAPTVVLVHGAWADASSWAGEVRMLQRAGVRVRAIANPVEDLTTDARYVAGGIGVARTRTLR